MKKKIFSLLIAIVAAATSVQAQQISVVSPSGATSLYRTLPEAIEGAANGSVVYLPGGGFTISDEVKITKKLTIIGIGHKSTTDNVDGISTISGNLNFNQGSDGSAVMGCYITGDVNIAEDAPVNSVAVKLCNINSVQVKNAEVKETYIYQNYIRSSSGFSYASCTITNNVMHSMHHIKNGTIKYNIMCNSYGQDRDDAPFYDVSLSHISNNILKGRQESGNWVGFWRPLNGSDNYTSSNIVVNDWQGRTFGDNPIIIEAEGSDCFIEVNNWSSGWEISSKMNYHFKDEYKQYESQVGIYAGSGFDDSQMAPVPYIMYKDVPDKTDAEGKLKVRIRVKANQ